MPEHPRIEDLRRRVQKDPASIAFAQLAEEYRRAGQYQEAVEVCRAGLAIHPGYLSARVTLGRAFVELHELDAARGEFEIVLKGAPENLAAVRGLAEVFHKSGALAEALAQYRAALTLARNDPDLEQTVADLTRQLAPKKGPLFDAESPAPVSAAPLVAAPVVTAPVAAAPVAALPRPEPPVAPAPITTPPVAASPVVPAPVVPAPVGPSPIELTPIDPPSAPAVESAAPFQPAALLPAAPAATSPEPTTAPAMLTPVVVSSSVVQHTAAAPAAEPSALAAVTSDAESAASVATDPAAADAAVPPAAQDQVKQTIEALEQWLDAIHVSRADRSS